MNMDKIIAVRTSKTIYRDGDACIKVFNENYSKSDVFNEALNSSKIEETGLDIPEIREITKINGKWAIISDFIEGKTLAQLIKEYPEKKNEYIEMLVDIQLEINSRRNPALIRMKDKMNRKIRAAKLDASVRYELHARLEAMPKHDKVCHGDLNPSNVIVKNDGTPFVTDWAHASQGNASADTAGTYLFFCFDDDNEGAEFYLNTFCQKSDTAKQYVKKWIPVVAASLSVKGTEREKKFLLGQVNIEGL